MNVETLNLGEIENIRNIDAREDTFFVIEPFSNDVTATLNILFPKSKKEIKLIFASKIKDAEVNLNINVIHRKNETKSDMQIRTVLEDGAKVNVKTNIKVTNKALNCEGNVEIKALATGKNISWNVEPNLEISNKNVSVRHKASMISFNKNQITYLKLRGFTEEEAMKILKEGFLLEETGKIPGSEAKKSIMRKLKL